MAERLKQLLENHPIFSRLGDDLLTNTIECALSRHYQAGEYVTYYGDVWPYLLIVASGCLEVAKESCDGKQLVALTLKEGEAFWGLAFFNDDMETPVLVQARENSEVYLWARDQILPFLLESPLALWDLCQQIVSRMNQASQIVENLAFKPMAKRLACLLLDMFSESSETSLKRTMTLDDIAARVGSSREEVCRALYQFADKNLIEITRTEFSLVNKDGLAYLADQQ